MLHLSTKGGPNPMEIEWRIHNPTGSKRVVVTKELPGKRWLDLLTRADCQVVICTATDILDVPQIKAAFADHCDGAIGQLTENWGADLFKALKNAGGRAYSNYAVGFNNVDVDAATRIGIPVGNTPGVLTETTAEMAVALTMAAARRVVEADTYMRGGRFKGWIPTLFLGQLLQPRTGGIIGAGRIGTAYARMMVEGFKMNLIYYDLFPNETLETYVREYGDFLKTRGEKGVSCRRATGIEQVMREADVISLHTILDDTTHHLIDADGLARMKDNAIFINTSRGPLIDESALVAHCRKNPNFRAALDVFEDEPAAQPGLNELANVVMVPHIASATSWTREGMATLAAANVTAILQGFPTWNRPDILPFLSDAPPAAAPSILNAEELGISIFND